jgi:MFS family permease
MKDYFKAFKNINKNMKLLLMIEFLVGFSLIGGITNVLQNIYIIRMGFDEAFIGVFSGVGLIIILMFTPISAILGNKLGIKRSMILGILFSLIGIGLIPSVMFFPDKIRSFLLFFYNFIGGMGIAFYIVNVNPFIMKNTNEFERTHVYSAKSAITPIGGFIGSVFSGYITKFFSDFFDVNIKESPLPYSFTLFITPLILLFVLFLFYKMDDSINLYIDEDNDENTSNIPFNIMIISSLVLFFMIASEISMRNYINVYLDKILFIDTSSIGWILGFGQLIIIPAALSTPILKKYFGLANTFVLSTILLIFSMIPIIIYDNVYAASLSFILIVSFTNISRTSITIFSLESVKQKYHTFLSAVQTISSTLGSALIIFSGGFLIKDYGYNMLFLFAAFLTIFSVILFYLYFYVINKSFINGK